MLNLIGSHPKPVPECCEFDQPLRLHRHRVHHILYLIDDAATTRQTCFTVRWKRLSFPRQVPAFCPAAVSGRPDQSP